MLTSQFWKPGREPWGFILYEKGNTPSIPWGLLGGGERVAVERIKNSSFRSFGEKLLKGIFSIRSTGHGSRFLIRSWRIYPISTYPNTRSNLYSRCIWCERSTLEHIKKVPPKISGWQPPQCPLKSLKQNQNSASRAYQRVKFREICWFFFESAEGAGDWYCWTNFINEKTEEL